MYEFVDTTQLPGEETLPAEAVCFNDIWLDKEIEGFRTLNVSGRELFEQEIDTSKISGMNGETINSVRYPARTITVTYQLIAGSNTAFREAYNQLNGLLSEQQAQLIFADETDKYFIATKASNDEVDPGLNSVTGEIEFFCADPCKYAVDAKTVTAETVDGILTAKLTNEGNVAVPIDYEIMMNSDNGYIGILSEDGKTMQYGSIEEADGEDYKENETLVTLDDFFSAADDTTGTDYMHPQYGAKGTLTTRTWFDTKFLAFGTKGDTVGSANGGLRTITIPADSSGAIGAVNWYCYQHLIMWIGKVGQTGEMCINFLTDDNELIAGLAWYKSSTNNMAGGYEVWANGEILKTYYFNANNDKNQNPWMWNIGNCCLMKSGANLTSYWKGQYFTFHVPEIENLVCTKIQIAIKAWGDRVTMGDDFISHLGLDQLEFQKLNVDKWKDVPNRYSTGDVLTIDGDSTKVYLNGQNRVGDEVLGSEYFQAQPGDNTIEIYNSSWAKDVTAKATIREAWV